MPENSLVSTRPTDKEKASAAAEPSLAGTLPSRPRQQRLCLDHEGRMLPAASKRKVAPGSDIRRRVAWASVAQARAYRAASTFAVTTDCRFAARRNGVAQETSANLLWPVPNAAIEGEMNGLVRLSPCKLNIEWPVKFQSMSPKQLKSFPTSVSWSRAFCQKNARRQRSS